MSLSLTRRAFLAATGAAPFAASALAAARAFKNIPIGLELYSVRTELASDLLGTVTRVAGMGYQIVEFYAPYFDWTPATAKDVRQRLDGLGITCRSTHNNGPSFTDDGLKRAIELNQIIGSTHIVMASPPRPIATIDGWKVLADQLTGVASKVAPLGMSTGYHNHQTEWPLIEGQRPMDVLAANTPKNVVLQFDVGTCVEARADPVAWIRANPGRIRSMHCKDWGAGQGRGYAVAFGEGDVPWASIFDAAESVGGVEYYLIEQEQSPDGQQFKMAQHCLDNWWGLRA